MKVYGNKKYTEILISVIVPIYNIEAYLKECIDSIINQSYKNLEVILVDDGSTDLSGKIIDDYSRADNRIKVIHKNNGGIISARKAGVEIASGDYITFVDGDDWIEPEMYTEMIQLSIVYDPDIVTSGVKRDYGNHTVEELDYYPEGFYNERDVKEKICPTALYTGVFYESGINIHVYNKIYKSDLIKENYNKVDNRINVGEDAAIVYPCIYSANSMYIIRKSFYHYRIRTGSCMDNDGIDEEERLKILKDSLYKALRVNQDAEYDKTLIDINALILYEKLLQAPDRIIQTDKYGIIFPFGKLKRDSRIVLYGAGRFGKRVKAVFEKKYNISIVAWVDKNAVDQDSKEIQMVDCIKDCARYDYIVIAVLKGSIVKSIVDDMVSRLEIEREKIIYIEDSYIKDFFELI